MPYHHGPQPENLDRRADAMIELLSCPVRWASKKYVLGLAEGLIEKCAANGRQDLSARIRAKIDIEMTKFD